MLLNRKEILTTIEQTVSPAAMAILKKVQDAGYGAYFVGGFLRDILLNRLSPATDIDIATSALPEEIIPLFSRVIPTGIKHGTVTVHENGMSVEITTYRTDGGYSDSRHPESVRFITKIEDDLARRDFTINAMAADPVHSVFIDLFGGLDDLQRRVIRTVGNPSERFTEDALRMLRAIRFSNILMFEIEETTLRMIRRNRHLLANISRERMREEFNKLLLSDKPSYGIDLLRLTGILQQMLPELEEGYEKEQNEHHKYDVYHHNLYSMDAAPKDILIRLAALLHDTGKPKSSDIYSDEDANVFYNHELYSEEVAERFLREFRYSNHDIEIVLKLIRFHMFHYTREWTEGAIRRFVAKVGEDMLPMLFALRVADRIGNGKNIGYPPILIEFWDKIQTVIRDNHALKVTDLAVNGHDIMETFALKPSPIIGKTLATLLDAVLENQDLNERERLIEIARRYITITMQNQKSGAED